MSDLPKECQISGDFISASASSQQSHGALLAHGGFSSLTLVHAETSLVGKMEHLRVLLSFHPDLFHLLLSWHAAPSPPVSPAERARPCHNHGDSGPSIPPGPRCSCPVGDLGHPLVPLPSHGDPADVSIPTLGLCSHCSPADIHRAGRTLLVPSLPGISQFSDNGRQGDHQTKVCAAQLSSWPELVLLVLNPPGRGGLSSRSLDLPGTQRVGICFHLAAYSPTSHSTYPWLHCDPAGLLFILMHSGS